MTTRGFSISAVKNTAFTNAPITSARIHPYVFILVAPVVSAKLTAIKATIKAITSDNAVILLTTTSTMKNTSVKDSIHSKRTRFGPKPIFVFNSKTKKVLYSFVTVYFAAPICMCN
uniref:Uncharacterized protein n=1 Tax=Sinocyclocheilus grahami TaxID=75366 RepID=A0A672PUZ7_SINGR